LTSRVDPPRLSILHVGSGFRPLRHGGLVAYVEDLMEEQARRGHHVTYLFAGRYYPFKRRPRLRRWERNGVTMLEIVNSPLHDHGRQPELELKEPRSERIVESVIAGARPDVVHVQELAGLPFSVLDVVRHADLPSVMTLQDYFPLCSTFKLLDADGRVCLRRQVGDDCVATVGAEKRPASLLFRATAEYDLDRRLQLLPPERRRQVASALVRWLTKRAGRHRVPVDRAAVATAFQRRRDLNVERLNQVDCLVAMSKRVEEIYAQLGVDSGRLRPLQLTLAHIERLRPRVYEHAQQVTFATLGGGESVAKGSRLLMDAVRLLEPEAREERFRLILFGHLSPATRAEAAGVRGVEVGGRYPPAALDALLDQVDVGIMPSIWEEAYGYAGMEFLAKGIPVIANAIGGMVDYVRDGETGWLNHSRSAAGLAELMRRAIQQPDEIGRLNEFLRANRAMLVKTLAQHADEMDGLYREVIAEHAAAGSSTTR
jgi:glycosyltransferase involved in cell wall biosynthesis